jgi:hypothetical protein
MCSRYLPPSNSMTPFGDHLRLIQAYVGGLFREQGLDVVKQWLDPLFRPLIDHGYEAERRDHLVPGPSAPTAPATTSSTPPQSAAPTPSPGAVETAGQTNADVHARLRSRSTRNSPVHTPSVSSPLQRETDRPNIRRKRRGDSLREGGSRDAGKISS